QAHTGADRAHPGRRTHPTEERVRHGRHLSVTPGGQGTGVLLEFTVRGTPLTALRFRETDGPVIRGERCRRGEGCRRERDGKRMSLSGPSQVRGCAAAVRRTARPSWW